MINKAILLYNSGLSISEVANSLGITIGQSKYLFQKSGFKLRNRIEVRTKKFNKKDITNIIKQYNKNISLGIISKKYNCSSDPIKRVLTQNKIRIRNFRETMEFNRKYKIKHNFLNNLDSWEKLYFLGWMFSDGNNDKNGRTLKLCIRDKQIIDFFGKTLFYKKYHFYKTKDTVNNKILYSLHFHSKNLSKKIFDLGCVYNKSLILKFPENISDNKFFNAFLLGYFEGDGCANIYTNKVGNKKLTFIISTGSLDFKVGLEKFLLKQLNIISYSDFSSRVFRVNISKTEDLKKIYDYLYLNSKFFLKRKHDKFIEFFKYKLSKQVL